jgi:hypothetical protein
MTAPVLQTRLGARREATRQDSPPVTFFVVQADTSPTLRLLREILHRLPGGTKPDPPRSNDALQAKAIPFKKPARNSPELPQRASALTTIEENFRDTKDLRFGMGLSYTHIGRTDRRDRLLLIGALAQALLTLLGAAAEDCGLDRTMKANTVKRRTHSLFRQGCFFYSCIPMMPDERVALLMNSFRTIIAQHAVFQQIFAIILCSASCASSRAKTSIANSCSASSLPAMRALPEHLRSPELLPLCSRIRRRLALDYPSREELLARLDHLLVAAGNPSLMTSELRANPRKWARSTPCSTSCNGCLAAPSSACRPTLPRGIEGADPARLGLEHELREAHPPCDSERPPFEHRPRRTNDRAVEHRLGEQNGERRRALHVAVHDRGKLRRGNRPDISRTRHP